MGKGENASSYVLKRLLTFIGKNCILKVQETGENAGNQHFLTALSMVSDSSLRNLLSKAKQCSKKKLWHIGHLGPVLLR